MRGDRTSILAYEDEVETMKRAKRELEREMDDDIPLHTALVMFSEMYLDSRGELDDSTTFDDAK